jgi:DNA polymerase elongation subunit (family B)
MVQNVALQKVLFFDVETVSSVKNFSELPERMQLLWTKKHHQIKKAEEDLPENTYQSNAAIYAEFGKIICISCGFWHNQTFRIKSFYGDNEKQLLEDFASMLHQSFANPNTAFLCGHNIKEFDVPYVCRRMLVNSVELPKILDVAGKKPWEVNYLDTLQLWKFGDYKNYTSLDLLAAIFDIPTPKDDIDGSMVGHVYWEENDLERIKTYCEKDVVTVLHLFQKLRNEKLTTAENILVVS